MSFRFARFGAMATALSLVLGCSFGFAHQNETVVPETPDWKLTSVAEGIAHPWAIAWLPSGEPLITARDGTLHTVVNGAFKQIPMEGLPEVFNEGQGGLLDIAVHPKGGDKPLVYMTLATGNERANRTILVRGTYDAGRIVGIETLFQVRPDKTGAQHFGSRLLWLPDRSLLMTIGDGGNPPLRVGGMLSREQAQNLKADLGKILRLDENGKAMSNNPFVARNDVLPEIWSYGHRNIQGLTLDDATGRIWSSEHGPRGGDELNLMAASQNYGWPLASHGRDYTTNEPIGRPSVAGMIDPKVIWTPSVGASGLAVYTGAHFADWQGDVFSGGLVSLDVQRVRLDANGAVTGQERLPVGKRVRDVRMGPDGYLYVLTDEENGQLLRFEPR